MYFSNLQVSSNAVQKQNTTEWILHSKHKDLLDQIDLCLQNVTNLEMAASATYHLATHTPQGGCNSFIFILKKKLF